MIQTAGSTTESESSSLFFDIGAEDRGTGYLDLGLTLVSPDEDLLAYSVDTAGDEVFELRFRDLRTGEDLPDRVPRSYYGGAWSADSQSFFYTVHDDAYRPYQVWRHRIGTDAGRRRAGARGAGREVRARPCGPPAAATWW